MSSDFDLLTWGWGKDGQLGHGDRRNEKLPAVVEFLHGRKLIQVACGGWHTSALTVEGEVFTWGSGRCGQLGHGDWASHRLPCVVAGLQGKTIASVCSALIEPSKFISVRFPDPINLISLADRLWYHSHLSCLS